MLLPYRVVTLKPFMRFQSRVFQKRCFSAAATMPSKKNLDITLYQFESCPFCTKVRTYMDFHKMPYKIKYVIPMPHKIKHDLKSFGLKSTKVPTILVDGSEISDSTKIIDDLEKRRFSDSVQPKSESEWRKWSDEHLVKLLPVNVYGNLIESFQMAQFIASTCPNLSVGMKLVFRTIVPIFLYRAHQKKKTTLKGTPRQALYEECEKWMKQFDGKFFGGEKPNLADLSVFGYLKAIEKTYASRDILANTSIAAWYKRMDLLVGQSARVQ
eukprot:194280_1